MKLSTEVPAPAGRASPLPQEERRAMIIHAVIPLLLKHGRELTSRQIAEAAGVAEGTIYRAFGDKQSLIEAAIQHYFDPEPMRAALKAIDQTRPLDEKVHAIITVLQERFARVFRIMAVLGADRPALPSGRRHYTKIVAECLAPDAERFSWSPERVSYVIRLITFSSAFPPLNDGNEFSTEELSSLVLYGVTGSPQSPESN